MKKLAIFLLAMVFSVAGLAQENNKGLELAELAPREVF